MLALTDMNLSKCRKLLSFKRLQTNNKISLRKEAEGVEWIILVTTDCDQWVNEAVVGFLSNCE